MKFLGTLLKLLVLAIFLALVAAPFVLLQPQPVVAEGITLDRLQAKRARALLDSLPRDLAEGEVRVVELAPDELSLALNYALQQLGGGGARAAMDDAVLQAQISARLPLPIERWFNLELSLYETGDRPAIDFLRLGTLTIPGVLAQPVLSTLIRAGLAALELPPPDDMLKQVAFSPAGISFTYEWHERIASAVREQLVPAEDAARLRDFHEVLVASLLGRTGTVRMPEIAQPLFRFAETRAGGGDPVADTRAAMMVLAAYATGRSLKALVPAARDWAEPQQVAVTLHERVDLARHFLNSAVLAATGGELLSKAIGLSKEIDDSRGGSGFSFIDLLADEAGTRFGRQATESRKMAREFQQRAAGLAEDEGWMPAPTGLEEAMTEADFKRRYGGTEGARYKEVLADIEARLDASPLHR